MSAWDTKEREHYLDKIAAQDREIAVWKERAMQAAELLDLRAEAMRAKCYELVEKMWPEADDLLDALAALKGNRE